MSTEDLAVRDTWWLDILVRLWLLCEGLLTSHGRRLQVSNASRGNKLNTETVPVKMNGSVRRPATTKNLDGQECPSYERIMHAQTSEPDADGQQSLPCDVLPELQPS
jgi:hypothetical protein